MDSDIHISENSPLPYVSIPFLSTYLKTLSFPPSWTSFMYVTLQDVKNKLLFQKIIAQSNNSILTTFRNSQISCQGILAQNCLSIRREYNLLELDLDSSTSSDIGRCIRGILSRKANEIREGIG